MKSPAPQPTRESTPPRERRLREELRLHQRKLETLERNTMHMMSRSLTHSLPSLKTPTLPTAPIYEPPKVSAKVLLKILFFLLDKKNCTLENRPYISIYVYNVYTEML